jgi:Co/Zn/Cd efflux system component
MYAETVKARQGYLDGQTKRILEVYIPSFSVCALLAVSAYITSDAVNVLISNDDGDDVDVTFMYAFAAANFLVDVLSALMFYCRGKGAFENPDAKIILIQAPIRTFSLDGTSNIAIEEKPVEKDYGDYEEVGEKKKKEFNLNMLSALTHVGGDTLRTASVFIAALVSTFGGVDSSTCDAYAAIVVTITIVLAVIPLCMEIYKAALRDF